MASDPLNTPPAAHTPATEAPAPVVPILRPRALVAEIDASCREPLLFLFGASLLWLVVGLVISIIASIKLHGPGFLAGAEWLTVGRVRPAGMNALLYGFATQAAIGLTFWLLCRLGGTPLRAQGTLLITAGFWNLAVALGIVGILTAGPTGFTWLEMPRYIAPMLFVAFVIFGVVALAAVYHRRERTLYVTQWYLIAGLLWFAWIWSAANLLLLYFPVRGVLQAGVNAWYTNNLFHLWFAPVGLGAIYYFVPKLIEQPLASSRMASFGFWTLAIFANWAGLIQLIGGPVPAWMVSASIAAALVLVVPVTTVMLNWHLTLYGSYTKVPRTNVIAFLGAGAGAYVITVLLQVLYAMPIVSLVTHFTLAEVAASWLGLLGFTALTLFGGMYYIVPRLVGREWPSPRKTRLHFWCSVGGVGLLFFALFLGGVIQGFKMNIGNTDFIALGKLTAPFIGMSSLGLLVLLAGQCVFLAHIAEMVRGYYRFGSPPGKAAAAQGKNKRRKP